MREAKRYRRPWSEERPLVSVTVATLGRPELTTRSLPSILAQTYENIEVIVAGDGAPSETEDAIAELADSAGPLPRPRAAPELDRRPGAALAGRRDPASKRGGGGGDRPLDRRVRRRRRTAAELHRGASRARPRRPRRRPSTGRSASTPGRRRPTSASSHRASATSHGRRGCTTAACASSAARRWPRTSACRETGGWRRGCCGPESGSRCATRCSAMPTRRSGSGLRGRTVGFHGRIRADEPAPRRFCRQLM